MRSARKADPPELLRGSASSAAGEVPAGKAESLAALVPDMSSTATWHRHAQLIVHLLLQAGDQNANVRLAQSPASWVCREKSFMLGILGKEPSEPVELLLPKIAFSILICTNWRCSLEPHPVGTAWQPWKNCNECPAMDRTRALMLT